MTDSIEITAPFSAHLDSTPVAATPAIVAAPIATPAIVSAPSAPVVPDLTGALTSALQGDGYYTAVAALAGLPHGVLIAALDRAITDARSKAWTAHVGTSEASKARSRAQDALHALDLTPEERDALHAREDMVYGKARVVVTEPKSEGIAKKISAANALRKAQGRPAMTPIEEDVFGFGSRHLGRESGESKAAQAATVAPSARSDFRAALAADKAAKAAKAKADSAE